MAHVLLFSKCTSGQGISFSTCLLLEFMKAGVGMQLDRLKGIEQQIMASR